MASFRSKLISQAQSEQNENQEMNSFYQERHYLLGEEEYDTSQALTYVQGLTHVKGKLKKEVADALEESTIQRQNGVVVQKNKAYLKKMLEDFTEMITTVVEEEELRFRGMTSEQFIKQCTSELVGFDILDDAFADDSVSDIFVYAWNKIYVESHGENKRYERTFRDEKHYQDFIERLVKQAEVQFNKGDDKITDFQLFEDRFCAVNQVISTQSSSLTIRKHGESHIRLSQIIAAGGMNQDMADLFGLIFKGQCNLIYAGITGSGKTTSLRALVDEFVTDLNRRILTAEDTRELFLENDQTLELVTFKSKDPNKSITLSHLVKTALRLKPKYILVGEVRGEEAEAAVEAAATGHSTSFTMHAEKPIDTINRLVINYQKAMPRLGSDIVERIIGEAIDYVAIQKNIPGIGRRVVSITEVSYNYEKGRVALKPIMVYDYELNTFKIVGDIAPDVIDRMLGAGVKMEEIKKWRAKVPNHLEVV